MRDDFLISQRSTLIRVWSLIRFWRKIMSQFSGNQGTVLVVEDDHNTAALVATYLEREGFSTKVVNDGGEAMRAADACDPVFVILDVMLPNMDGWEICRTLRKSSDVPIMMLTAREEEIDRVAGLSMGA